MGINTATKKFKEDLVDVINKSGLPSCIVEMVLDNALGAVRQKVAMDLQAEAESEVAKDAESIQPDQLGELSE